MNKIKSISCALFTLFIGVQSVGAQNESAKTQVLENLSKMPIQFRENIGQWDNKILFNGTSPAWNANVHFMKDGLSFGFSREKEGSEEVKEYLVWSLKFENANTNAIVSALGKEFSHANYLIGNNPAKHKTNVPDYRYIKYENIYNNIDVQYYGTGKELKYDFILNPGADVNNIKLKPEGIKNLRLTRNGILEIETAWGILQEELPVSYQLINGEKQVIPVSYKINDDNSFGFKINENYDASKALIIDPVNLKWSQYVGTNTATSDGYLYNLTTDQNENTYVTGYYDDQFASLMQPGVYDNTFNSPAGAKNKDVIVYKLNKAGNALDYATFVGGSSNDAGLSIKVNAAGEAFVAGFTESSDFPFSASAYNKTLNGAVTTFCFKLNATGTALSYSTFLGAGSTDLLTLMRGIAVAINNTDEAFVCGPVDNSSFATSGAYDASHNGGTDVFLAKLNPSGTSVSFATFFGGAGNENATDITVDSNGDAYMCGTTNSADFPTLSAYNSTPDPGGKLDAFVAKFSSSGNLVYSTYLGGTNNDDYAWSIVVTSSGEVVVGGNTTCADFPTTTGAYDVTYNGNQDGFVTKLNAAGNALLFSTFFGHGNKEFLTDVEINSINEVYVCGYVFIGGAISTFPVTACAYQNKPNGYSSPNFWDFFVSKFDANCSKLLYSSFMGGNRQDYYQVSLRIIESTCPGHDDIILGGTSHSDDYPSNGSFTSFFSYGISNIDHDIHVISRFTPPNPDADFTFANGAAQNCQIPAINFTDATTNNCSGITYSWNFGDGSTSTDQNPTHAYSTAGDYTVTMVISCPNDTVTKVVTVVPALNPLEITPKTISTSCAQNNGEAHVILSGASGTPTFSWSPNLGTDSVYTNLSPGSYTVVVSDPGSGCTKSQVFNINSSTKPAAAIANSSNITCPSGTNGSVDLTVNGGASPYTYNWNNGSYSTEDLTNVPKGTYNVIVTDSAGCKDSASVVLSEPTPSPIAWFPLKNDSICEGGSSGLTLTASGGIGGLSYLWMPGNLTTSSVNLSPTTTQTYTVVITDGCGQTVSDSIKISVVPYPHAVAQANPLTAYTGDTIHFTNLSTDANYWLWTFGDKDSSIINNPTHTYLEQGTYTVTLWVTNELGCPDSTTIVLDIKQEELILPPNIFTPNNQGEPLNETFLVKTKGIKEYQIEIYDRWGLKMFESNNINNHWDGNAPSGRQAPDGTYYYIIKAKGVSGKEYNPTGYLQLIR